MKQNLKDKIWEEIRNRLHYTYVAFVYGTLAACLWNVLMAGSEGTIYAKFFLEMFAVIALVEAVCGILMWHCRGGAVQVILECVLSGVIIIGAAICFGWIRPTLHHILWLTIVLLCGEAAVYYYSYKRCRELSRKINQALENRQ